MRKVTAFAESNRICGRKVKKLHKNLLSATGSRRQAGRAPARAHNLALAPPHARASARAIIQSFTHSAAVSTNSTSSSPSPLCEVAMISAPSGTRCAKWRNALATSQSGGRKEGRRRQRHTKPKEESTTQTSTEINERTRQARRKPKGVNPDHP